MSTPERYRADEAIRWLASACGDLLGAEAVLADQRAPKRNAAYLAQQAAEKSLRAVLIYAGIRVPRSHRLDRLLDMIPGDWSVHGVEADLLDLSAYSTSARYPDAGDYVSPDEARSGVDDARAIHEAVKVDLARRGVEVVTVSCA